MRGRVPGVVPHLSHDGDEGALPDVAALAAHVGAGHDAGSRPGRATQGGVVRHHLRACQGRVQDRVPSLLYDQLQLLPRADKDWADVPVRQRACRQSYHAV